MKAISFSIPMPPSVNALYVNAPGRGRVKTKVYARWIDEARIRLMLDRVRLRAPLERYGIALKVPADMRGDISNRIKAAEDLCKRHGLIFDDKNAVSVSIERVAGLAPDTMAVELWEQP